MGVRLIVDREADSDAVAMYDSVSGFAFGPVFRSEQDAQAFLDWFDSPKREQAALRMGITTEVGDPRAYPDGLLEKLYGAWLEQRQEVEA